mmetsp:Transcript_42056/g.129953  ORF Transcript_42056/g.129953 Transcript_42056/m.129953 type:complete len:203 (+) Transcript_42056:297-905(+)
MSSAWRFSMRHDGKMLTKKVVTHFSALRTSSCRRRCCRPALKARRRCTRSAWASMSFAARRARSRLSSSSLKYSSSGCTYRRVSRPLRNLTRVKSSDATLKAVMTPNHVQKLERPKRKAAKAILRTPTTSGATASPPTRSHSANCCCPSCGAPFAAAAAPAAALPSAGAGPAAAAGCAAFAAGGGVGRRVLYRCCASRMAAR